MTDSARGRALWGVARSPSAAVKESLAPFHCIPCGQPNVTPGMVVSCGQAIKPEDRVPLRMTARDPPTMPTKTRSYQGLRALRWPSGGHREARSRRAVPPWTAGIHTTGVATDSLAVSGAAGGRCPRRPDELLAGLAGPTRVTPLAARSASRGR